MAPWSKLRGRAQIIPQRGTSPDTPGSSERFDDTPGIDVEKADDDKAQKVPDIYDVRLAQRQDSTLSILDEPETHKAQDSYLWRLDLLILPTISACYFFEYLDRGNVANAKLLGLSAGHGAADRGVGPGNTSLSAEQWEVVIMIAYVGLILFQIPGCIGFRIFPPSKWIAFGVCGWCAVSMLQSACYNYAGLLACRIFLGAFEGLFGTGIVYYLSLWYHRRELSRRLFWYLGPTSLAGAFGGLIAYGVGHINSPVAEWKWLFIVEAAPGFILGLACLWILPDRPLKNSKFSGRQLEIAHARYYKEGVDKAGKIQRQHVMWAVCDWRVYIQAFIYVPTAALLSSISGFLPTLVSELGYKSSTSANLMTVPPYACAFVAMYIVSYSSDYYRERGLHIALPSIISAISYLTVANLPETALHAKYGLLCVTTAMNYATYPPGHAWVANNLGNETKRAIGLGIYTAIGNFGSIAGSFFYPTTDGPLYKKGHYLACSMSIAAAVVSLSNKVVLTKVNRYRDRTFGRPEEGVVLDLTENADAKGGYRFIT